MKKGQKLDQTVQQHTAVFRDKTIDTIVNDSNMFYAKMAKSCVKTESVQKNNENQLNIHSDNFV